MTLRNPILQAFALLLAAMVCAFVANAAAPRQRQLVLVGNYPNALRVPARSSSPAAEPHPATTSQIVSPAPSTATETMSAPPSSVHAAAVSTVSTTPVAIPTAGTGQSLTVPPATSAADKRAKQVAAAQLSAASAAPPLAAPAKPAPSVAHADVSRFAPHPDKPYVEITGADAASLHSAGVLFLDARRTSVFEQGHVAGARSVSVWESDLDEKVRRLFDERNDPREQAKPVVIYCSGGDCEDSHMLAEKLWGIQFNNLYVYKDGFPDWQKRGGAVHAGSSP